MKAKMREKVKNCHSCFLSVFVFLVRFCSIALHVCMCWNDILNVILVCRFDQRWERLILIIKSFMMPFSSESFYKYMIFLSLDCHLQFLTILLDTSRKANLLEDCDIFAFQFVFSAENLCPT